MNYCGQNLQGRSFKGETLEGANFSKADIKGADFTDANLTHTNFSNVQAGVQKHWKVILVIASWLISGISVIFSGLASIFMMVYIVGYEVEVEKFYVIITLLFLHIILFIIAIWLDLIVSLAAIIIPGGVAIAVAAIGAWINYNIHATPSGFQIVSKAITFLIVFCATGTITFAGIVVGAIAVAINTAIVIALGKVGFQFLVVNKDVIVARFGLVVTVVVVATAIISIGEQPFTIDGAEDPKVRFFTIIVILTEALLSAYIGWRALKGDEKKAWIRSLAIAFAAFKGTSFHNANLTDADFTQSTLKSTDFRGSNLTRTCFHLTKMLDYVCPGRTYLENAEVRQLLVTGQGQNKIFDRQDLRGINLQEANLMYASFIDTDLSQANLQEANLFEAKLVRTNLDLANLDKTHLTGAYIEDWGITSRTRSAFIDCEYVYLKLPTEGDRDPNRMPPSGLGNFEANDFSIFITSVLATLDLYHKQEINSSVAITVLKGMTQKYPVQFEMVGLENRGNRQFVIRLKVHGQISYSQLQKEYYSKYEQILPMYDPKGLLSDPEALVEQVIKAVNENPSIQILNEEGIVFAGGEVSVDIDKSRTQNINTGGGSINNSGAGAFGLGDIIDNQGDTVSDNSSNSTYNLNHAKLGGGFAGTGGTQSGGTFYDYSSNPSLAEAAAEIQQLLQQLEATNPTTTSANKSAIINQAIEAIENNPALKTKVIAALNSSGTEALKTAISHPLAKNMMPFIEELAD